MFAILGSTCTSCVDGFYLDEDHLFARVTCLKKCDITGCSKCYDAFYSKCKECDTGYDLTDNGYCTKK